MFDLAIDRYETNNLINGVAGKKPREQMQAEFDRQVKATDYRVPDYADRPGSVNERPNAKKKQGKAKKAAAEKE